MPSSSFFSGTNPTPTEYENAVDLVAQATAQATAALASQTAAATSAQSAQGYSVSAGTSADTATTQAASAASSATSASNSATNASSSASSASSSATSASTSASNAATSATNASNSATSAAGSASSASTYATNAASSATAAANSASDAAATLANALVKTNNLADLSNAGTARTNLGVAIGSNVQAWDADLDAIAAISSTSGLLKKTAANTWTLDTTSYHSGTLGLSEGGTGATDAAGARSNLGLGTAATAAATSFLQVANNLSDLTSASSARTALGLGSAALLASSAVLQSANNLSDLGNVTTARSSLGLGPLATLSSINNSNWSGTALSVSNGGTGLTSLTAGYIPYGNGTGAFGSSSGLFFDGTNLGVGTASPSTYSAKIAAVASVDCAIRARSTAGEARHEVDYYGSGGYGSFQIWRDNVRKWRMGVVGEVGASPPLQFYYEGVGEYMRIASDGSVGIGTSSPLARLHVCDSSATSGTIRFGSSSTYYSDIKSIYASDEFRLSSYGGNQTMTFYLNGSERLRIASDGSVGIGTTSTASAKLTVSGAGNAAAILTSGLSSANSVADIYINRSSSTTAIIAAPSIYLADGTNNRVIQSGAGNLQFFRYSGSWLEDMRLDTSGNLGLGVTPSAWGSSWKALQITSGGMSLWSDGGVRSFYSTNVYYDGSSRRYVKTGTALEYSQADGGGHSWSYAASGSAGSAISFTHAMTLSAAGKLSINTTTTDVGQATIYHTSVAASDANFIDPTKAALNIWGSSSLRVLIGTDVNAPYGGYIQATNTSNGNWPLYLNPAGTGQVLIGTTTLGASKLVVNDSSIQINTAKTPASATATGTQGQVCWDSNYIYVCVGTSQWKRAAIASW